MKKKPVATVVVLAIALLATGAFVVKERQIRLPAGAPENPSAEFVRAAKVLKPLSPEEPFSPTEIAFWECFGALTDQQLKTFMEKQSVTIDPASASTEQRKALGKFAQDKRIQPMLQKAGAAPDLSNVKFQFTAQNHLVSAVFSCRVFPGSCAVAVGPYAQVNP